MAVTPNEIWEPSIPAFILSPFWVNTTQAHVKKLVSNGLKSDTSLNKDMMSLLIQSQVSHDGLGVGVIKLLIPRYADVNSKEVIYLQSALDHF